MTTLADLQAQLQQERQERRRRLATDLRRPLVYVALGASDAVGVGASSPERSYVELLAARLRRYYAPERAVVMHNLAVSGYTVVDIERDELSRVPALAPDVVTVWAGGNDIVQSVDTDVFRTALQHILHVLQGTGAAFFVGTVPDLSVMPLIRSFPAWLMPAGDPAAYARHRSRELGDVVLRQVPAYGGVLVNLPMSEVLAGQDLVASDGFHPSDAGHARLADAWWREIRRLLE